MNGQKRLSRLNPVYLARRHAGVFFACLALGLLAGVAWRSLLLPVRYSAEIETVVTVEPPERAARFDWRGRLAEWRALLRNGREQALLRDALRHAVKLAATRGEDLDGLPLSTRLAMMEDGDTFSATLFPGDPLARLSPVVTVARRDLAANMDFRSLAAVVADCAPPPGAREWGFSFFQSLPAPGTANRPVTNPSPEDPYFRVFYRLYAHLNGGTPAASPEAAWRCATDELSRRLDREAGFSGGGGFGPRARREIAREIAALPVLAANALHLAGDRFGNGGGDPEQARIWDERLSGDTVLGLSPAAGAAGTAAAGMRIDLLPLGFPRDTAPTRVPPLAVSTLLSFLAAREGASPEAEQIAPPPAAEPASRPEPPVQPPPPRPVETAASTVVRREVVDEAANAARLARVAGLETEVERLRRDRDACRRRLNLARERETRLSFEALSARNQAERLRERHDAALLQSEADFTPKVPPETQALFAARDAALQRLRELLAYCTEEHPFVREARRELGAIEQRLAGHTPDQHANRLAELRATRLAELRMGLQSAAAAAESLETERRLEAEAVVCLAEEMAAIEGAVSEREGELADAKRAPVPTTVVEERVAVHPDPVPAPVPVSAPAPAPAAKTARAAKAGPARLAFAPFPERVPLRREAAGWSVVGMGVLAGTLLGLLCLVLRELFASRFRDADEAARLVGLPVLAALPAYDAASMRLAAAAMPGRLAGRRAGTMRFIPVLVEKIEPPAEARRTRMTPGRKRPRLLAWTLCLLFVIAAGLVHYKTFKGVAAPEVAFTGEMALPSVTVAEWLAEMGEREEWGNQP